MTSSMKVIIIPGMGCTPITSSNWYLWLHDHIQSLSLQQQKTTKVECELYEYPDPYKCRESIWVPFIQTKINDPSETILIGHSTGAACAMRLLEHYGKVKTPIKACILVATAYTDLNDNDERMSEYFNRSWDWKSIQYGCTTPITIFHSVDDPLIPVTEAQYIVQQLTSQYCNYYECQGKSHFFEPWDELLDIINQHILY